MNEFVDKSVLDQAYAYIGATVMSPITSLGLTKACLDRSLPCPQDACCSGTIKERGDLCSITKEAPCLIEGRF